MQLGYICNNQWLQKMEIAALAMPKINMHKQKKNRECRTLSTDIKQN